MPTRAMHGMAVGSAGQDLKKLKWRTAGRPLICCVKGYWGSECWFDVVGAVMAKGGFNDRVGPLIRHHNGRGGDPKRATAWLDREPTEGE